MINKREIVGSGKYAVGQHQQFVDREGARVRVVQGNSDPVPIGEAYAFFDCGASKEEIEREIPAIRDLTQTPSELELHLMEGTDSLKGDSRLRQIADEARGAGIKYVMTATYPLATNRQAADELAGVLNQVYQSPLFAEGQEFRGSVIYQENGEYISRD